ncbi:MAG: hypothetical protein ABJF88_07265, partial [Rhodothermales bacterium]
DRIERVPTRDLQAFLAFSRGLQEEDAGDFAAAAAAFAQAAALDPGFELAATRAGEAAALSSAGGTVSAALGAGKAVRGGGPSGGPGGPGGPGDLLGSRLSSLNESIGSHVVPTEETRSGEVPFAPPEVAPIPDPPPPPPNSGN